MPIYEYRRPDGTTFEVMQGFSEDPLTHDPESGVPVERVLHAPAVHFKGKGFYNTDYGTRKRQRETASATDSSSKGLEKAASDTAGGSSDGSSGGASSDGASSSSSEKKEAPAKAKAEAVAAG